MRIKELEYQTSTTASYITAACTANVPVKTFRTPVRSVPIVAGTWTRKTGLEANVTG